MNIGVVTVWGERGASVVSKSYIDILSLENEIYVYSRGGESSIRYSNNESNVYYGKESYIPITNHINKRDFISWLHDNKIKLVLFNEQHWFEPLLWLKELGIKSVSYVDYYTDETIPLYDLYDAVICNTRRHLKAFQCHAQAKYIPWGVDTDLFSLAENTSSSTKTTFFHSCGMNPLRKGTDLLLLAGQSLAGKFEIIIHSQLDLNSFYKNDPEILACIESLENRGLLKIITKTVTAPGLYKLGNVYVYPCRLDGLGLTVPEALASGLPTIIPDAEPMREFASPVCSLVKIDRFYCRKDGYYWPQQLCDIKDLANKMNAYITNSKREKNMHLASEHAQKHLNWEINAQQLNQFINNIKCTPVSEKTKKTYIAYKNYGYRKILTKVEKYNKLFSPLFSLYAKLKEVNKTN